MIHVKNLIFLFLLILFAYSCHFIRRPKVNYQCEIYGPCTLDVRIQSTINRKYGSETNLIIGEVLMNGLSFPFGDIKILNAEICTKANYDGIFQLEFSKKLSDSLRVQVTSPCFGPTRYFEVLLGSIRNKKVSLQFREKPISKFK